MNKLIGISGKAGSGKDTVARHLWEKHGFLQVAFADPLREAASALFGLEPMAMIDREMKETHLDYWGKSPRQILQILGNDALKPFFGDDVWLKRWLLTYGTFGATDDIVASDCRFDLECNAIRELGGTIIHLKRPGAGLQGVASTHASEAGVTIYPLDYEIINDGTIEDLKAVIDQVLLNIEARGLKP